MPIFRGLTSIRLPASLKGLHLSREVAVLIRGRDLAEGSSDSDSSRSRISISFPGLLFDSSSFFPLGDGDLLLYGPCLRRS